MILPGSVAFARGILSGLRCVRSQVQTCGVDLSMKRILTLDSAGAIDFDNSRRANASSTPLPFERSPQGHMSNGGNDDHDAADSFIRLSPGTYLVEFNETIHMPNDIMGQIFVRSSLFRSGAHIHAGVMDAGYHGLIGAMLEVRNASGLCLFANARLAQMVFHSMTEPTNPYSGKYQGHKEL